MNKNKMEAIQAKDAHPGHHFCQATYTVNGEELVNTYQCKQGRFSTSDMWFIRRNKKEVSINTGM